MSKNADIFIVSHKTHLSANKKVDLVQPARNWIRNNLSYRINVDSNHVFFEESRTLKVERIESLGLTHFVDDLIEVFQEEKYPKNIKSFWLSIYSMNPSSERITVVETLDSIVDHV
jgi:hypothetical protein